MTRTHHHHAKKHIRQRLEIWSRRCKQVSMDTYSAWAKRITHRFERRQAKVEIQHQREEVGI